MLQRNRLLSAAASRRLQLWVHCIKLAVTRLFRGWEFFLSSDQAGGTVQPRSGTSGRADLDSGAGAMADDRPGERLSQISTAWTTFFRAHAGPADEGPRARRRLLELYGPSASRYLRAATRDPD